MRLKGCVAFLLLAALLALEGCSPYNYSEREISLDSAKVYSLYWNAVDSALIDFAADTSHSGLYVYGNYSPQAEEAKRDVSKDSSLYKFYVLSYVSQAQDYFSIKLIVHYEKEGGIYGSGDVGDTLYVDIYGCTDYACKKAEKVVVHNEDYSFTKLLKKGKFEISTPDADFSTTDFGYDCDVVKDYFFHLKIDLDEVKIDLDAQKGSESCYDRSSKFCVYC